MNKKNSSGSGVFLMEMIVVVFFFMICSSICILVFVKANNMSRLAKDTNQSVIMAESVAEVWKQEGEAGLVKRMNARPGSEAETSFFQIYWDSEWELSDGSERAAYEMSIRWNETDGLAEAELSMLRLADHKILYEMTTKKYHMVP